MEDFKEEKKDDSFDFEEISDSDPKSLLQAFVSNFTGVKKHDLNKITIFNKKLNHCLSSISDNDACQVLNAFYKANPYLSTTYDTNITAVKACLISIYTFSQTAYLYSNKQEIFNQYWNLLVLLCKFGANPSLKQDEDDYEDDIYSFNTLCEYLLPALHNLVSNQDELLNRYMFIMTFGTEKNGKDARFDPAIFSIEYTKYSTSSNINIDIKICGGAFMSPMDIGSDNEHKLKELDSALCIYQLLQNGYALMENTSNDEKISTMIADLCTKNESTDWINYRYNSMFILYLWILKTIYKEFRTGYHHLLNQCYIPLKEKDDEMQFDFFFVIMDFVIGEYNVYLNEISEEYFCKYAMKYFPALPKKIQFWCMNFILEKLSEKSLSILKEATRSYTDKWPKLFANNYGNNKSDTNILIYLLKLYQGEFVHGVNANDFRVLLKRQCHNRDIVKILMSKKLKRSMINKKLLVDLWIDDEQLTEENLKIILDKIYEEMNDENGDNTLIVQLSRALVSAFEIICMDEGIKNNSNHVIWNRLQIILDDKYMQKEGKWIDLSEVLEKIFDNNQMLQFLMEKKLLNIDDCFKDIYKLKRALLKKSDMEYSILKMILNYLMKYGENYKQELKLICVENGRVAINVQNKPKCSQCYDTCASFL